MTTTAQKLAQIAANEQLIYQKGVNDGWAEYWNGFFRTGRTDFSYAFVNSGLTQLNPPETIEAELMSYMFMNCTNITDASNITIENNSEKPNCVGICMGCVSMTKPPVIEFTNEDVHVIRSYVSAFANCVNLTECEIYFGDGTQNAAGERTDMANAFYKCTSLSKINFTGSGSPKNLDLSDTIIGNSSTTFQSLANALMDVSESTGIYTIKLGEVDESMTPYIENIETKGWTIINV